MATTVLLSLGSNIGDSVMNIRKAVELLAANDVLRDIEWSGWYRTEPVGYTQQPHFVNVVVKATTMVSAEGLIAHCKNVETHVGRSQRERWRQREIDIDVVLYGDSIYQSEHITIPHPRMHERNFVLVPACDVAPTQLHPVIGVSLAELRRLCSDEATVDRFEPTE